MTVLDEARAVFRRQLFPSRKNGNEAIVVGAESHAEGTFFDALLCSFNESAQVQLGTCQSKARTASTDLPSRRHWSTSPPVHLRADLFGARGSRHRMGILGLELGFANIRVLRARVRSPMAKLIRALQGGTSQQDTARVVVKWCSSKRRGVRGVRDPPGHWSDRAAIRAKR